MTTRKLEKERQEVRGRGKGGAKIDDVGQF